MTDSDKNDMMNIVTKIRERAEKFDQATEDFKQYQERAEADIKKFDDMIEDIVKKNAEERKRAEELEERVKHMELLAATASNSGTQSDKQIKQETFRVMNAMLKGKSVWPVFVEDDNNLAMAQRVFNTMKGFNYDNADGAQDMANFLKQYFNRKAAIDLLRSDIGELGGVLCPPEYSSELSRNIIERSPIRQFCRTRTTGSKTYKYPRRVGIPVATRPGEAREGGTSVSNYIMEDFSPIRMTNTTPVTRDELLFENYNLAGELVTDNSEAFAVKEGQEFVTGTGVNEGLGFTVDPNVPEYSTATSTLSFDDVITLSGELKSGYTPMYFFNRRTLVYLRLLKDQNDRYLWSGPFGDSAAGSPATINGLPYSSQFIDMDDYDIDNGYPILFADMLMFFMIVDRTDISIINDPYTRKVEGIVEYTMNKWTVGKPNTKEAGIRLKKIA